MSTKTIIPAIIFFIGVVMGHLALARQTESAVKDYLENVRGGQAAAFPHDVLSDRQLTSRHMEIVGHYLSDSLPQVRRACYRALDILQKTGAGTELLSRILDLQMRGLQDPSPDIVGISVDNLSGVANELFSPGQKQTISQLLGAPVPKKDVLVRKAGALGDASSLPALRALTQAGQPASVRWAAYLALSRMGDQQAIAFVDARVRKMPVGDDLVYELVPDIIYTHQKQLYAYIVELLYSNERHCEPADPDQTLMINCAYRLLEQLAPVIAGFPVSVGASGDLATTDYRQALQTAREWFSSHAEYELLPGER